MMTKPLGRLKLEIVRTLVGFHNTVGEEGVEEYYYIEK